MLIETQEEMGNPDQLKANNQSFPEQIDPFISLFPYFFISWISGAYNLSLLFNLSRCAFVFGISFFYQYLAPTALLIVLKSCFYFLNMIDIKDNNNLS